jgi:hypothetical protein
MPNYEGIKLKLRKFGGLPEAYEEYKKPLKNVEFQLYFSADGKQTWTPWHQSDKTKENGEIVLFNEDVYHEKDMFKKPKMYI